MKCWKVLMCITGVFSASHAFAADCNADGLFDLPDVFSSSGSPTTIAVADLDLDGDMDIVVANGVSRIAWFQNDGDGGFGPRVLISESRRSNSVAVGDVNGDGYPDIVASHPDTPNGGEVSVSLGKGDGTFGASQSYDPGANPYGLKLADVNGDGRLDIITLNIFDGTISVFTNILNITFTPGRKYDLQGGRPVDFTLGDVDFDGDIDLIVADDDLGIIRLVRNNGSGGFNRSQSVIVGNTTSGVCLGDLDGDGDLDLVAVNLDDATQDDVVVLRNNGIGVFSPIGFYALSEMNQSGAIRVSLGDLNGDGHLDIITANMDDNNISVMLNAGDASFGDPYTYEAGGVRVRNIALGDFNSDGTLDIVEAHQGSGSIGVWVNQCNGMACVADLTGDGILNFFDVAEFLEGYAVEDPAVDFTGDGIWDFFDVAEFLELFDAGCS